MQRAAGARVDDDARAEALAPHTEPGVGSAARPAAEPAAPVAARPRKRRAKNLLDAKGGNRHERKKSLRAALVAAAGGTSPQEIAKALRAALSEEEAKSFLEAFTPLVRTGPLRAGFRPKNFRKRFDTQFDTQFDTYL